MPIGPFLIKIARIYKAPRYYSGEAHTIEAAQVDPSNKKNSPKLRSRLAFLSRFSFSSKTSNI